MEMDIFSEDHKIFRRTVAQFCEKEVTPHADEWRAAENTPREVWKKMGEQGFLGAFFPEEYGGYNADFLTDVVLMEELARSRCAGLAADVSVSNDIVSPYLKDFGTEPIKKEWLPKLVKGEAITSVAITEPGAGSDVAAIRTTAIRDGDHYVINGQKTFITCGFNADCIILAAKTNPKAVPAHSGVSLIFVPRTTPGYNVGRKLKKMGGHDSATAELYFEDMRVPVENLLGTEGGGFIMIMQQFQHERLVIASMHLPLCEMLLEETIKYTKERHAFGKAIASFQVNKHKLVEMATQTELAKIFLYTLLQRYNSGDRQLMKEISMAKYWITELANKMAYDCLQLHGGYGYMDEYWVSRVYTDVRAATIVGGTTEIMKELVARTMGL